MAINPDFIEAVRFLHPNVSFTRDVLLQDDGDGNGPRLIAWHLRGDAPTDAEIAAAKSEAKLQPPVDLVAYTANARWLRETGGITVAGVVISTDRQSQAMIAGAFNYIAQNNAATVQWKSSSGKFVTLDAPAIAAIAFAVGAHVQACFSNEAKVQADIAAGTITTTAQIDVAFASI